jgi:hypothetical protein
MKITTSTLIPDCPTDRLAARVEDRQSTRAGCTCGGGRRIVGQGAWTRAKRPRQSRTTQEESSEMSDRKYRQRGYMDDERDRRQPQSPRPAPGPRGPRERPEGPRTPNLMSAHEVVKCHRCGERVTSEIAGDSRCHKCGADLHACAQCASFDPGSRFECMRPIPARVSPKDSRNSCTMFVARTTIERQTGSAAPTSARKAFDDLFKF